MAGAPLDTTHHFVVEPDEAGMRLDQLLALKLPDHSRAAIQRWVQEGRVEVEPAPRKALKARSPAAAGARITVRIPPDLPRELHPEPIGLTVLHKDDALVVVDKPAGLVAHPSPGHAGGTLVNALLYHEGEGRLSTHGGEDRPGLVHRLDRDTSGIIVIARTDAAHRALARQFKERTTEKVYLALTSGAPRDDRTEVDRPIGRSRHHRKKMAVDPDGRPAQTTVEVLERLGRFALVRCYPRTGRTHQIRVHLHALGSPVLCDPLYGREREVTRTALAGRSRREKGEPPVLTRHALHAHALAFTHPLSGERVRFEAPLPADMEAVLSILRAAHGS